MVRAFLSCSRPRTTTIASVSLRCSSSTSLKKIPIPSTTSLPRPHLDYVSLTQDPDSVRHNVEIRKAGGVTPSAVDEIVRLRERTRELQRKYEEGRRKIRTLADTVQANPGDVEARKAAVEAKEQGKRVGKQLAESDEELLSLAIRLPNSTHPSTPVGPYSASRTVRTSGPAVDDDAASSPLRDHLSIATLLGWVDMHSGARTTGPSWPFLVGQGALLEFALSNYALSRAIAHGFVPVLPPDVVKAPLAERCGFNPRDGEAQQTYFLDGGGGEQQQQQHKEHDDEKRLALCGTAEIPLAGYLQSTVLPASSLPVKMVALGRAFRAEAGARGKESRGLYRVHQFSKVELFVACEPDESDGMLEELVSVQEDILAGLGLPLRCAVKPVPSFFPAESTFHLGYLKCRRKSWVGALIASMTLKRGCLAAVAGER
jgi:seryl-tRNA synthetase